MKINIKHTIPAKAQDYWDLLSNPKFSGAADDKAGIDRKVIQDEIIDGINHQRVKWISRKKLPGILAKALGTEHLEYEMVQKVNNKDLSLTWEIIPPISVSKFMGKGRFWVVEHENSCERFVDGEILVKIPFIGKKIEEVVVNEVIDSYQKSVEEAISWLSR